MVVNRRVPLVILVASLLLTLVVGQVDAQTPVPHRNHLRDELTIKVEPARLKLCVGEKQSVVVIVKRHGVYEDVGGARSVSRPSPYRLENNFWGRESISIEPTDSGDVVRQTDLEPEQDDLRDRRDARTHYEFVGTKVGSSTIEFVADQPGTGSAQASLDIEVTECDYRVVTSSIWHIDATGWNTVFGVSIRTEIVRGPDGIYLPNSSVAAETVAVEFPSFGCGSSITEAKVRVVMTGGVSLTDQDLIVLLDFPDSISGSKFVTCAKAPGSGDASGSLFSIEFSFDIGGGHAEEPHILRVPGLGDFSGMTYITVTPIHR